MLQATTRAMVDNGRIMAVDRRHFIRGHLRTRRGFPLLSHRLLGAGYELVRELAELAFAVAEQLDDERWTRAGEALVRAAAALRDAAR
jgi:hypothetical protein